jgi:hypothetical protein
VRAKGETEARKNNRPVPVVFSGFQHLGAISEEQVVSQTSMLPLKVCLLLRLGRADLAEMVWTSRTGWTPKKSRLNLTDYGVSYLTLASDWAWFLFNRTASTHARGEDPLALASARELARIQPLIEAKAKDMGFPHRQTLPNDARIIPYLDFLTPLPALLADQERRAKEPKRTSALKATFRDPSARIAALIHNFDQIAQRPHILPGRASAMGDAAVRAIIQEDDAAAGPLLECLATDDRLTRTVDRDYHQNVIYNYVYILRKIAYEALVAILGTREFGSESRSFFSIRGDKAKRAVIAAEIRAYWQKNRGLGPEERFFRIDPAARSPRHVASRCEGAGTRA